jgi:hypothetical protein
MRRLFALLLLAGSLPAQTRNAYSYPTAAFPGAIASDANLFIASNDAQSTLNGAITAAATSITVNDNSAFPSYSEVWIDNEAILVCGVSGPTLTVCASGRGADGTAQAPHANGATVTLWVGAIYENADKAEIKAMETALGANLSGVVKSGATAGGDLSGTYPSPGVAKVNGNTPGGTCTNQAVTGIDSSGRPTCTTLTSSFVDSSFITTSTSASGALTGTFPNLAIGSITQYYLPVAGASGVLGNSVIFQNGTNIGIGTTTGATSELDVRYSATGYVTALNVQDAIDPGVGATGLLIQNPAGVLYFRQYGSSAPGTLASAGGVISTGSAFVLGAAGSGAPVYFYSNNSYAAPQFQITGTGNVVMSGSESAAAHLTASNCSSSTNAAVCGSAAAGSFTIAASATSVVVDTTAVTANSQILVTFDASLGTKLGVTCNGTVPTGIGVSARTAGTSFTVIASAPSSHPACFSYVIIN